VPVPLVGFSLQGFSPSQSLHILPDMVTLVALATADRASGEPMAR
jgi:hypothetical protein